MTACLDDRMGLAVDQINAALAEVDLGPLSEIELSLIGNPYYYRTHLTFLASVAPADLSGPIALLDQWHAWHGGS